MKHSILLAALFVVVTFSVNQVSSASSISMEISSCTWGGGYIYPNSDVSFDIRLTNTHTDKIGGFSNGFRLWTTGVTSFNSPTVEIIHPDFESFFDLGHFISFFGPNGDTVAIGGAIIGGPGIPVGFDDVVYRIHTGGIEPGETLCIDSSYYPPSGTWRWASGSYNIFPAWSGQRCYTAEEPSCITSDIANSVESLNSDCGFISYDFETTMPFVGPGFFILSGPGNINGSTGEWSYSIPPEESGTTETLIIGFSDGCECGYDSVIVDLNFNNFDTTLDLNDDCSSDISDLVLVVQYMFGGGVAPTPLLSADMNADAQIDVSDLVWIVNYMFNGGPPPLE